MNCFVTKQPVRKDPAVHVSLSSDSLFKQPGDLAIPNLPSRQGNQTTGEAHASDNSRMHFHWSSEELRRRAIAP